MVEWSSPRGRFGPQAGSPDIDPSIIHPNNQTTENGAPNPKATREYAQPRRRGSGSRSGENHLTDESPRKASGCFDPVSFTRIRFVQLSAFSGFAKASMASIPQLDTPLRSILFSVRFVSIAP